MCIEVKKVLARNTQPGVIDDVVLVVQCAQTEACETMKLLKLLPVDVNLELMQTIFALQ